MDLRDDANPTLRQQNPIETSTLAEYINKYLNDCYALSPNTQRLYARHLDRFLRSVGDHPVSDLSSDLIRRYMSGLRRRDGRRYSAAYLDQVYRTLHTFLEWLVEERALMENPMKHVRRVRVPKRKSPRLNLEEIEQLIDAVRKTSQPERNLAIVYLMLGSGLRRGEVVGLRLGGLDLDNAVARVFGKDQEEREIPLSPETVEAIKEYLKVRPSASTDRLFLTESGKPLTTNALNTFMYRLKTQAELPQLRCHLLRHTFANYYIAGGGSLRKLQKILGHSDIQITAQFYTDPELSELVEEHARVNPLAQIRRLHDNN